MRGRAPARDAPVHVDGNEEDPFSFPARARSQSPSRAALPSASEDRDSLRSLYECTGGESWRTSLGWPSWVSTRLPTRSRNPFGEAGDLDDTKRRPPTAMAAAGAGASSCTPQRSGGRGSPGNPFARTEVHNGNPFAPQTPATRACLSQKTTASQPAGAAASARRATETLASPPACPNSPAVTPAAVRRATERLPSPLSPPPPQQPSRSASPLTAAADARKVWGRHHSPSLQPGVQARSASLSPPRHRRSSSHEAGAAWFGVSLGAAGRVAELKLVDNGLVGTLPSALGGLEMLRYLHLGRNTLSGGLPRRLVVFVRESMPKAPTLRT